MDLLRELSRPSKWTLKLRESFILTNSLIFAGEAKQFATPSLVLEAAAVFINLDHRELLVLQLPRALEALINWTPIFCFSQHWRLFSQHLSASVHFLRNNLQDYGVFLIILLWTADSLLSVGFTASP